jgi:hypothetical protein
MYDDFALEQRTPSAEESLILLATMVMVRHLFVNTCNIQPRASFARRY